MKKGRKIAVEKFRTLFITRDLSNEFGNQSIHTGASSKTYPGFNPSWRDLQIGRVEYIHPLAPKYTTHVN